jgi:pimeloyl-ACP methyl ester carboxylesterase
MANTATTAKEITFIKKDGKKIEGRIYLPERAGQRFPIVIFCHGFGSNYRELMHHGDGFAEAGICCLFFDFCGGGPKSRSDGAFEEMTVESECGDLETVIDCVKELDYVDPERIFLQGESMGGLVSALAAARRPGEIRGMVLWYPAFGVPDGARKRYETGEREVFGLRLGEAFDREAKDIDVYGIISAYCGPVLMIHGDQDAIVPLGYSERALSVYGDARLIVIPGAGHGYDGADSAAAREASISFLRERM